MTTNGGISADQLQQILSAALQAAATTFSQSNSHVEANNHAKAENPKRPLICSNSSQENWSYFLSRWSRYKTLTGIAGEQLKGQLLECCDDDLQLSIHRSVGESISEKSEQEILADIKKFAVQQQNILVCRNALRSMSQDKAESIQHFAARVKGQANLCDYTIKCSREGCGNLTSYADAEIKDQICNGLYDPDILQDVLSSVKQDLSLNETINFIAAKESGKRCHTQLSGASCVSKISEYQKGKRLTKTEAVRSETAETCLWCGNAGHGKRAPANLRKMNCAAYGKKCRNCGKIGHFAPVCRNRKQTCNNMIEAELMKSDEEESAGAIFLAAIRGSASAELGSTSATKPCQPVKHREHESKFGWRNIHPDKDPTISIQVETSRSAYDSNSIPFVKSENVRVVAIADTGARTTVAGTALLSAMGLKEGQLFPVEQKLCGANNSRLSILGGLFLRINVKDNRDNIRTAETLCYIQDDCPDKFFLSRKVCEQLGFISDDFPRPSENVCDIKYGRIEDVTECTCPKRSPPPDLPTRMPYPPNESNRARLEQWLLDYYGSSTFNICEHQVLPMMTGAPLKLIVNPEAQPKAVHTPIPVPVHWQKEVKAGLDRDVKLGVIEPVPWGTPTTWCARMVTVPKKDGTPRRTVDLQALNAVSSRQTHHVESPFHQATSVPKHMKKTTCDAWNGYHSVPICEEDRNLTTFITPWGRYRYCTAPQGYIAAGDAYSRRYDEIIADLPNKKKCVDDTIMWAKNIDESFYQTCRFLDRCARNGIVLNPKKFAFARDVVEFAGFEISRDSVKPSSKYLAAIKDFPTPKDITGVRSWFGLVNQVSYAFSMTKTMQPFRELLKPDRKFYWDENLQKIFDTSKKTICDSVETGVRIFDPKRVSAISTDWSKDGTGFLLTQKYCNCKRVAPHCCKDGWKLVLAGSKFNSKPESNYAPIEGECLAVVRALHKCRYFVLGCENLVVATDHKPLVKILGDRNMEEICNPRLFKLKERTLKYKFTLIHVAGKKNSAADAISRNPPDASSKNLGNEGPSKHGDFKCSSTVNETESYIYGVAISSLSGCDDLQAVTWEKMKEHTLKDPVSLDLLQLIQSDWNMTARSGNVSPYNKYIEHLTTIDSIILYKSRVVVPITLRPLVLQSLHAGHQGVSSMMARAETSVFWPGLCEDVQTFRARCSSCNTMAPSQPDMPPTPLTQPEYPFQHICADYFQYMGEQYMVIVDRYSNWPSVMKVNGSGTAEQLIEALKTHCEVFGIPEELASDGGSQFTAYKTKQFLKNWGIKHRISSAAYPHSNCRAELGVKCIKRMLVGNIGSNGSVQTDKFRRAMMQYRNTPDRDTKQSPAEIVFGRTIRDFIPCAPEKYRLGNAWKRTAEYREIALTKRHSLARERLSEHTKELAPLEVGDPVYIQNQVGKSPLKWDKSGTIVEVNGFDQYMVKVDGSGRLTRRNRKFLRKFTPYELPKERPSANNLGENPSSPNSHATYQPYLEQPAGISQSKDGDQVIDESQADSRSSLPLVPPLIAPDTHDSSAEGSKIDGEDVDLAGSPLEPVPARSIPEVTRATPKSPKGDHVIPRRSQRIRKPNPKYKDYVCYNTRLSQTMREGI